MNTGGEDVANTTYVFADDMAYILESGTYEFSTDGIVIAYGANDEYTYTITETDEGFTLLSEEGGYIPLIYMEGTDGLLGDSAFSGIYSVTDDWGFIFHEDGTLDVITENDHSVSDLNKDKTAYCVRVTVWDKGGGKLGTKAVKYLSVEDMAEDKGTSFTASDESTW